MSGDEIEDRTRGYFQATYDAHGATSKGLDYNGRPAHYTRLGVLAAEVDRRTGFSVADVGCGYGSLLDALYGAGKRDFAYRGYDLVEGLVERGRAEWGTPDGRIAFVHGGTDRLERADYVLASGVFNIKQDTPVKVWRDYVLACLEEMSAAAGRKTAATFLTAYSDEDRKRDDLYYPDPADLFAFAMKLTGQAAIRHDYGLYDFTLVIGAGRG